MDNRPIGVFDSGAGGLTVLKELRQALPWENFIYFGDTARVPYGTKTRKTIIFFACRIMDFLLEKNIKMAVAACHTVSSNAISVLRQRYKVPIVEVIKPGAAMALRMTGNNRIGVIGTQSTIQSHIYKKLLLHKNRRLQVFEKACPLFVPIVEEGLTRHAIAYNAIVYYLSGLKKKNIDTLVLGCTHYPLLAGQMRKFFGPDVAVINSGRAVSLNTRRILEKEGLASGGRKPGRAVLYVSDYSAPFLKVAQTSLGLPGVKPKVVPLE